MHDGQREVPDQDKRRARVYERISKIVEADALHDLIARHGPAILDREFPYIVVAARNQLRGGLRRTRRETTGIDADAPIRDPSPDPSRIATDRVTVAAMLAALATLDDRDVLVVWRNAEGVHDAEIVAEWDARGLVPLHPSEASIRKRRERARKRLTEILDEDRAD